MVEPSEKEGRVQRRKGSRQALAVLVLVLGACNTAARAPAAQSSAPRPAPAQPEAQVQEAPKPAEAPRKPLPAAQIEEGTEDDPVDPAEIMRAMRHNCCDEAPASEIKGATKSPQR